MQDAQGMVGYLTGILILAAGGALSAFLPALVGRWLAAAAAAAAAWFVLPAAWAAAHGTTVPGLVLKLPGAFGPAEFGIDSLSGLFVLATAALGGLIAFYGAVYLRGYQRATVRCQPFFFNLLLAAVLSVLAARHVLVFLVAWELMSVAAFLLILPDHERESVGYAAVYYLVAMHLVILPAAAGFALLAGEAGSYDFAAIHNMVRLRGGMEGGIAALLLIGFAIKAGLFPFHTWLPLASFAASHHAAAGLASVVTGMGFYGMLRVFLVGGLPADPTPVVLVIVGLATAVWGVAHCVAQGEGRRLLAYSSVANGGLVALAVGFGLWGARLGNPAMAFFAVTGGVIHLLHLAVTQGLLFLGIGEVFRKTGSTALDRQGGLARSMPGAAFGIMVGSAAVVGLPPTVGFLGQFLVFISFLKGSAEDGRMVVGVAVLLFGVLGLVGALSLVAFAGLAGTSMLGRPRTSLPEPETRRRFARVADAANDFAAVVPIAILASFVVGAGLYPRPLVELVIPVVADLLAATGMPRDRLPTGELLAAADRVAGLFRVCLLVASVVFATRWVLLSGGRSERARVWDCGYRAGTSRMQYTSSGFRRITADLLRPLVRPRDQLRPPLGPFPNDAAFESETTDSVERRLVGPSSRVAGRILDLFARVQNGETRQYILYGLVFLVGVLAWVLGSR